MKVQKGEYAVDMLDEVPQGKGSATVQVVLDSVPKAEEVCRSQEPITNR